jgi:metal-responsive CopG/Arc/MetJ family transcriptional regulator
LTKAAVKARSFSNRSQAFQDAVEEKVSRLEGKRLVQECAKLDKAHGVKRTEGQLDFEESDLILKEPKT